MITQTDKIYKMATTAIFSALIILMTIVPYTGYLPIIPAAAEITTLHVVVILGAVLVGPAYGGVLGGVWGLSCWARAAVLIGTPGVDVFAKHPEMTVLPRILVGVVAGWLAFKLAAKGRKAAWRIAPAVAGTLTNSVLVISMLIFIVGRQKGFIEDFITYAVTVNALIELAMACVLVPLIASALENARRR